MRGTAAKRMLLRPDIAKSLQEDAARGVPVQRAMKNVGLECSRPTIVKLLQAVDMYTATKAQAIYDSLHPAWLKNDGDPIQTQPDGWRYTGRFPLGEWVLDTCSDS